MPRYKVVEKHSFESTWIIDAANEDDARHSVGEVISDWDESAYNSVGEEIVSVEEIGPEDEE